MTRNTKLSILKIVSDLHIKVLEKWMTLHTGLVEQFIYTPGFTRSYCCSTPIGVYETPNIWIKLAKMVDHSCIRGILISIRRIKI